MAGRIPQDFIQELLARVDLVDLIDARVPLKSSGSSFVARCPFHTEKSPSFHVRRDRQFYHCFGCGAHGNAIGFLMEYERLSFPEAVEALAERVGLQVPRDAAQITDERQTRQLQGLYEVQEAAAQYYSGQFKEASATRAVEYLKRRGLNGELAKRYRLGYAPPGWRNLPAELSTDLLEASGLLVVKEGHGYDRFRDRIMFPIRDRRGRIVGFGGRVLGDDTPKYLNSPETPVFRKHAEVYGLYELLEVMPKPERILVVEGYMDVIALAQNGIPNAVATLGTATSGDQVKLLFRYTSELVFCFDGDKAGQKAAWKALEASLPTLREGRQLRFLTLPAGEDPDSLVRTEGARTFTARMESALPFSNYFFTHLGGGLDLHTIEGGAALVNSARPLLEKIPAGVFRDMLEARLAELSGHQFFDDAAKSTTLVQTGYSISRASVELTPVRMVLILLLQNPDLFGTITPATRRRLENHPEAGEFIRKLLAVIEARPGILGGGLQEFFRDTQEEAWIKKLINWETGVVQDQVSNVFADYLSSVEKQVTIQNRDERWRELAQKRPSELTVEEREEIRNLASR